MAVLPVVDYEPPPVRAVAHRRSPKPLKLPRPRRPSRDPAPAGPPDPKPAVLPAPLRAVATFADTALRRVLEVIDQRRPAAHLRPLLTPGLVDAVVSGDTAAVRRSGAAVLQRLRLQAVGSEEQPTAAEVFGTYRRGGRVHALACRVEQGRGGAGPGWQVVALHIG